MAVPAMDTCGGGSDVSAPTEAKRPRFGPAPLPPLLREEFMPNDPVHGLMSLPLLARVFVDTRIFQRMRFIQQLAMCHYVYPGAVHKRFFHSVGTAFLAHQLMKSVASRQPELDVTSRDILCVMLAGLCHDLGHPCYSHTFERFMHRQAELRRMQAAKRGEKLLAEEEAEAKEYEKWTHETASTALLRQLFVELEQPMRDAGLTQDGDGDDLAFIAELIDPPKRQLEELLDRREPLSGKELRSHWGTFVRGRPVEKAWMYEVVSNWRSGIDVDKFDYFRRDAYHLGIRRAFDHERYIMTIRVEEDRAGLTTLSPPLKDKWTLRDNMLELRKVLHYMAYQHKTVKKLEAHMIDILSMLNEHVRLTGASGQKMTMAQVALHVDPVAYPKLTDTFVEGLLLTSEEPALQPACLEFQRLLRRQLMRLVGDWDLPQAGDHVDGVHHHSQVPAPTPSAVIAGVVEGYAAAQTGEAWRAVPAEELHCDVVALHCGMKTQDPTSRIVFHRKGAARTVVPDMDTVRPMRHKVFVFWNPPLDDLSDAATLKRLAEAFHAWADRYISQHEEEWERAAAATRAMPPPAAPTPASPKVNVLAAQAHALQRKRSLRIASSCPLADDDAALGRHGFPG